MGEWDIVSEMPAESPNEWAVVSEIPISRPSGATRSWEEPSWGAEDTLRTTGAVLGGFAAMPVAGIGGLAKLITTGSLDEASKTMEGISSIPSEILTTERQKQVAGNVGEIISKPFVMAGEGWRQIGELTGIPYAEPVLGSMGEVAGMAAMPAGVRAAKWAAKETAMLPVKAVGALKEGFFPKPTPDAAMRQVLQSKGKEPAFIEADVEKGWDAFAAIDTADNKKFVDTIGKLREGVTEYSEKVDAALMKDPTVRVLDDLATVQKTKGGADVTSNYVKTALDNLEELYTKIEDPVKAGNIAELRTKAETEGLTKKEVNDIARQYGIEKKAFNKATGEPLTSVSAEAYENIRKGLKDVARKGMGEEAKELDSVISSLLNTERLLKQNAAASMKLQQRYAERGWGDKAGGVILDAINFTTLGSLKGLLRKALPSNVSLKQRNSAEIEGKLSRNLKIINKEIERLDKLKNIGPTGPAEGPPPDMYPERGMNPGDILENPPPPRPNLSGPLSAPEIAAPESIVPMERRGLPRDSSPALTIEQRMQLDLDRNGPRVYSNSPEIPPGNPPSPAEIVQPGATSGGKQPVPLLGSKENPVADWLKKKIEDGVNGGKTADQIISDLGFSGNQRDLVNRVIADLKAPEPGATSGGKQAVSRVKGPENAVTFLQRQGGVKWGKSYNGREMRQNPDGKRLSNDRTGIAPDEAAELLNDSGLKHPDGQPWDADRLAEMNKVDGLRNVFTPDKSESIINRQIRRGEAKYYADIEAGLREDALDTSAGKGKEGIKKLALEEIAAEEGLTESELAFAMRDADDILGKISEPGSKWRTYRQGEKEYTVRESGTMPDLGSPEKEAWKPNYKGEDAPPPSAPVPGNHRKILAAVPDRPWNWTAEDLIDLRPSERAAKLEKIWGPEEEFQKWTNGEGKNKRRHEVSLIDDLAADLDYAVNEGDAHAVNGILKKIQGFLKPQDYYAYEEIQNAGRKSVVSGNASDARVGQVPEARGTGSSAVSARYNQADLPGMSSRETFSLTNPETEIGRPQSFGYGPKTQGMTFREAQDLFKKHK